MATTVADAVELADAGVDVVIAPGAEAGGIVDGPGVAAALALGAGGHRAPRGLGASR